jgi:lysyl-tRNA synthetase class 2
MVPSPGLDRHLDAFEIAGAEPPRFLITSPEYQMKRLLVGGIPRCFQIARCFRRGEVGGRHNPEFTMLEWYRAFADAEEVVRDTEEIVRAVAGAFGDRDALVVGARRIALDRPFVRTTVAQAFRDHAGVEEHEMLAWANDDEETFFRVLVDRVEPRLASLDVPVVLHRYPAKMASLARLAPDDPRYAERFEVYVAGLELSNGFGELTDPVEQRARFERDRSERRAAGQPVYPIDERFLAALASGMPPSAGNALGLDRLVMLGASKDEIGDVLALPEGVL